MSPWNLLPLLLTLAAAARAAPSPTAPDTLAARAQGCATCHGPQGEGTADLNFPRIAGKPAGYLASQLKNFRDGQRSYPPMNYLVAYLHDDYLDEMAGYFAAQPVRQRAAIEPAATVAAMPGAAGHARSAGAGNLAGHDLVTHGDPAHGIPACSQCHGVRLTGLEPGIPGLIGLNSRYIAAQLVSWRVGTRHATSPDCMSVVAARLSETQIREVSGWLAAQPPVDPTTAAPAGSWQTPIACGSNQPAAAAPTPRVADAAVSRGEYLAHAGDCIACHSKHGGTAFAGGFALPTPFGTLYSPNITPDVATGIGAWSAAEFYQMLHTGRSRDGTLLYPAMPFPAYTKVTRADSDALFGYLKSLQPVHQVNRDNELRFPYNNRSLLYGWRALYFTEGEFVPQPGRSADYNRGAYLVQGLGHCASCHSTINALGGSADDSAFAGGLIPLQNWYAPSLTVNPESGLGSWSVKDIAALLESGTSMRGAVYGPMAEVTHNSLQYLTREDGRAMAVYLKSLQQLRAVPLRKAGADAVPAPLVALGQSVYASRCAACHGDDGRGMPSAYPPLAGNPSIQMDVSVNPLRMVLNGGYPPQTAQNPRPYGMPPFAQVLSDEEVAAVVTYIRVSWGNQGDWVTPREANAMRLAPLLD
jgi:cytochrome c553